MSDSGEVNGQCATLPSSVTAYRVIGGDPDGIALLARDFVGRSFLVAVGAYAMGLRGDALYKAAIGGAGGIELFVLGYAYWNIWRMRRAG